MRKIIITITILALIVSIVGTGVIVYIEGVSQESSPSPESQNQEVSAK